jgi:HD-GYP domain-containing protein (c-di-GMP phosphodiesterase class II)
LAIAKEFEWETYRTSEMLMMGALLHDIGKAQLPPNIFGIETKDMTLTQRKLYERHPMLGSDLLSNNPDVPLPTIQIVAQHHEAYNGTGFPRKLVGIKINPMARIVFISDLLVKTMFRLKCRPQEALKTIILETSMLEQCCPKTFKNLNQVLGVNKESSHGRVAR